MRGRGIGRVLLTGASGGIGAATARALGGRGARILLVGRDREALERVRAEVRAAGGDGAVRVADLSDPREAEAVAREAVARLGGVEVLVNNAGVGSFGPFEAASTADLERLLRVNVLSPMVLCREMARHFADRGGGRIVNVGSVFGSLGFPWFAAYSASKFALRGLSEALRRELDGTGIRVTHVAPRGTRTAMSRSYEGMARAVGMDLDPPERVAAAIVAAIDGDARERTVGAAESIFVRVNALFPRLVDGALRTKARRMRPFAMEAAGREPAGEAPRGSGIDLVKGRA